MKKVVMPPITIMLWEHDLTLLIRALRAYKPENESESILSVKLLDVLETVAEER